VKERVEEGKNVVSWRKTERGKGRKAWRAKSPLKKKVWYRTDSIGKWPAEMIAR
jgi:hypothetical protein